MRTCTWRFEKAEVAALRPGESVWSRIHVWEVKRLLGDIEGYQPDRLVLLFDDAGTWRALNHPFLSLEAYGAFGAELLLQTSTGNERDAQAPIDWEVGLGFFSFAVR